MGEIAGGLDSAWGRFFKSHPGLGIRLAGIKSRWNRGRAGRSLGKVFQISPWAGEKASMEKK